MGSLSADERKAFGAFRRRVNLQFYARLAAIETAVAAGLTKLWPGQAVQVLAAVAGSALVAHSVHRWRVGNLMRKVRESDENTMIALSAMTDLAAERETRRWPVDWITLSVAGLGLAAALLFIFS